MNAKFVKQRALESDLINEIRNMAHEQGLATTIMDYMDDNPLWKTAGTYLIVSPNKKYIRDLQCRECALDSLLEEKKAMGAGSFNPYYQIFDISEFATFENFQMMMNMMRKIQQQAVCINIFNSFGYEKLPRVINESAIWEMQRLSNYRLNESIPEDVRRRYDRDYKDFVKKTYKRYMNLSLSKENDKETVQEVSAKRFYKNRVDAVHETMSSQFKSYFEERVKDFPEFFYCINMTPIMKLKDLTMKTLKNGYRAWDKEKGITEWDIMIPRCYQHIFYQIMLEYNIDRAHCGSERNLSCVGELKECGYIRMNWYDLGNWDSLCKANGVKYYINHGDLEELTGDSMRNPIVAIHNKDAEMAYAIISRLEFEAVGARSVSLEEVEASKAKVEKALSNEKKNLALGFDHYPSPFLKTGPNGQLIER